MDPLTTRLARKFRKQQDFAGTYAPLYRDIFGLVADWLEEDRDNDPIVHWLLQVAAQRHSLDTSLLLLAGLHRQVLAQKREVQPIRGFYPTVGGQPPTRPESLADPLRQAIWSSRSFLGPFIGQATIQTNETSRGLCWLLPLHLTGWRATHLVELGASAGLNLLADYRGYSLNHEGQLWQLGRAASPEFQVQWQGPTLSCPPWRQPVIHSRLGCDIAPFSLVTPEDEQILASFVWADHPHRLRSLQQGVRALRALQADGKQLGLHAVNLPDQLAAFLAGLQLPDDGTPVLFYNTYLRPYLRDKGKSFKAQLARWAARRRAPVLWLQWEVLGDEQAPDLGWVGWTADLWRDGKASHWLLAWAHPHGNQVIWLPAGLDFQYFWRAERGSF